jgi:hypothetical protein
MNLEEYEFIYPDHGHIGVYYPKDIISKKFKKWLIECLMEELEEEFKNSLDYAKIEQKLRKRIKDRVERCFLGI